MPVNALIFFIILISGCCWAAPPSNLVDPVIMAKMEESKFHVSLRIKRVDLKEGYGSGHYCSGALISWNTVLSAAHCVIITLGANRRFMRSEEIQAVLGSMKRNQKDNATIYDIRDYKYEKSFDMKSCVGDIALLYLHGYVPDNNPFVKPIPLTLQYPEPGLECTITGFGYQPGKPTTNSFRDLYVEDLTVVDKSICRNKLQNITSSLEDQICVKWSNPALRCVSEAGSPMVCGGVVVGIFSFTAQSCDTLMPNVLTDVFYYKNWILYGSEMFTRSCNRSTRLALSKLLVIVVEIKLLSLLFKIKNI